jgi:hypothetical protein
MEQSPSWEANSHSASQEIPRHLVRILIQMNSVHTVPPCFPNTHFNIIFPVMPRSSKWSHPFRFSNQILYAILISPIRATCPTHLILHDLITLIMFIPYILTSHVFSKLLLKAAGFSTRI